MGCWSPYRLMMARGRKSKLIGDQLLELGDRNLFGPEGLEVDRKWIGPADRIGKLQFASSGQAGGDQIAGCMPGCVCGRTIDLGRVFP